MPQYDYYCKKCKIDFTENKLIKERDNCVCSCGEKAIRGISSAPFHLKGGGWSKTMSHNAKPKSMDNRLADGYYKK